jgi:cation transport protein ChaC
MRGGTSTTDGAQWVFGYGSLMWRPGFDYLEAHPATLYGYHRAFCIYSWTYRGTRDRPGLVLGLDHGGSCVGRAYRIAAAEVEAVRQYLHDREMEYDVYRQAMCPVRLADGRRVPALAHVVNRTGRQYTGKLAEPRMVELVLQGSGDMGSCHEYLANTVEHLDDLGIADGPLHRLLAQVERARSEGGRC